MKTTPLCRCGWLALAVILVMSMTAPHALAADYRFVRMWPTLPQPWYFAPHDVAIDADGYVYIAETEFSAIQKFTSDGAFVTKWHVGFGQFFANPTGVALDREGNVFSVDTLSLRKFTANGRKLGQWMGGSESLFYSVEVDGRDWVYITDWGAHCIHVYTTDGMYVGRWGEKGAGEGRFRSPTAIAADRDGFIYVTDKDNHTVQKFEVGLDKNGFYARFMTSWGGEGKGNGQFREPFGITAGLDGIYVVDRLNDRVQKFDVEGNYLFQWGGEGSEDGLFYAPRGISLDRAGKIYVAGPSTRRIQKFASDGRFLSAWQSHGSGGMFENPSGVALGEDGSVFVLNKNRDQVQKFSAKGKFLQEWGSPGAGPGELNTPFGIAVHKDRVYVADTLNDRVQVFQTDGAYLVQWGHTGRGDGEMDDPSAVAVDDQGNVYVADTENNRVQKFTPEGVFIQKWGREDAMPGQEPGEFFFPYGIAVDGRYLYVTDRDNERVQRIDTTGAEPIVAWDSVGDGDPERHSPYGIAVDADHVYVADRENDRVQIFRKADIDANAGPLEPVAGIGRRGSLPGLVKGPMDVAVAEDGSVYVVDQENNRIQVFQKGGAGVREKAIIVAAGGPYYGNQLWPATQALANSVYIILMHQGFTKETIHYLSPDLDLDLDLNGEPDDVDADVTNQNLEEAVTGWAADADRLILYITDHGKTGTLRLNEREILSSKLLDGWLDTLQNEHSVEVILVYDACYSGSFLRDLQPPPGKTRLLLTSTNAEEDAYFVGQGAVSFSSFFWTAVLNGKNLEDAYDGAVSGMNGLQHPQIDADGDGGSAGHQDLKIARSRTIGSGSDILPGATVFESFDITFPRADASARLIATGLTDPEGIARVWVGVIPPEFEASAGQDSVLDLPTAELLPSGEGRYAGEFSGFSKKGTYTFRLFARDRLGNTTQLGRQTLDPAEPLRDRALLTAGYSASPETQAAVVGAAELARSALRFQGYDGGQNVAVLGDLPDRDRPADKEAIRTVLADWAAGDTRNLVIWLTGGSTDGAFRLNEAETLNADTLAGWLDPLEEAVPGKVTVILDFDGAGTWIPRLSKGAAGKRILMAAAPQGRAAVLQGGGAVSFSGFFWRSVLKGENAATAFRDARDGLRLVAGVGRENGPVLEADGDGIGNEWEDHRYAADLTIGAGIRLTADAPISNSVSAPKTVAGNSAVTLRVEDVVTAGTMDRVWAVITPPDSGMGIADGTPMETVLTEVQPGIYEGTHDRWPWYGPYGITIFGKDTDGALTRLQETEVFRADGEDVYEDDSTPDRYPICEVNHPEPLHRSFHSDTDLDGVLFHAAAGEIYTLQVRQPGSGCDIRIEILNENGDLQAVEDSAGPGGVERLPWRCPETGVYSVRLTNQHSSGGVDAGYEFSIDRETAAFFGYLRGRIQDAVTGRPLTLARVRTDAAGTALSRSSGSFLMFHKPGRFDVTVSAPGYLPVTLPATAVSEGGSTVLDIELQPEPVSPPPVNPPVIPDAFPQAVIRSPAGSLNIQVGGSVSFEGAITSGDPPFQYEWDFSGAAETSHLQPPPPVLFEEPGRFRITFAATDADGDRSEASVMITVTEKMDDPPVPEPNTAPVAAISSPAGDVILVHGESVRFVGSASGGNGILTYRWTFDGAAEDSVSASPGEVVFPEPGTFTIQFSATDEDGDTDTVEATVTVTPKIPTPGLSEPASGDTNIPLGARLFAAADTDPPNGAFHTATRWQIAHDPGFLQPVLDRITDLHLTALTLPDLLLSTGREYYWRVQFEFEDGSVSEWSDSGRFVTVAADSKDADADGIADDQTVTEKDLGTPPANAICIRVETGGAVVCLTPVDNVAAVEGLRGFSESEIPDQLNRPQFLPMGLLSMRIRVIDPNEPAILRIDFRRSVTAEMGWHGYDPCTGWHFDPDSYNLHPDQSGVVLTIYDVGDQDIDGIQNGIIVHSSGPGTAPSASNGIDFEGPGDTVGGGCFIETAIYQNAVIHSRETDGCRSLSSDEREERNE